MNFSVERTWSADSGSFLKSIQRSFVYCSTGIADASRHQIAHPSAAAPHRLCMQRRGVKAAVRVTTTSHVRISSPLLFFVCLIGIIGIVRPSSFRETTVHYGTFVMSSTKRKRLSLSDKLKVLQCLDSGQRQVDVAKEYGIAPSTLSMIVKQKSKLEGETLFNPTRKRLSMGHFKAVDDAVAVWLRDLRSQNIPVSGPMIQCKAKEFPLLLDVRGFEASSGWLTRFRNVHMVQMKITAFFSK